ncbi:SGNH/GDSL hydrolase family protein [Paenibacillus sp. GCM10027626]|uniref:SGNH/GDSL hydrolase family protein n=1 Tax=Paenibacillus sp. GCM10027626 TaxID=3273411 RepID=UPI00363CFAD8
MNENVWQHRKPLSRLAKAIETGVLRVGFIGGSITDGRPRHNWPEGVAAWLKETYPDVRLYVENAAIGATGSELAVFRAERDLIDRECDIVFVDYAVNDSEEPSERRMRTREGLLRKLLKDGQRDVVLVHTFRQDFFAEMNAGQLPESIADFEKLADHYHIGSVSMGLYALEEVKRGRMRWEEWLPDGLHPTERGSLSYSQSVIAFLEREMARVQNEKGHADDYSLPEPFNPQHWGEAYPLSFSEIVTEGPWIIRRWLHYIWIDQVLETAAVGARLSFAFEGRGVALGFDFGRTSSEIRYRVDGGEWQVSKRERPEWCGNDGWYRIYTAVEDLPSGNHHFEMEVIHGDGLSCTGTNCRLGLVGIVR